MSVSKAELLENLREIQSEMLIACQKANRDPKEVSLVAVTKTVPYELVNEAILAGVTLIGENRIQEFLEKQPYYQGEKTTQFIGHLQTNKVNKAVEHFDLIASVDSGRLLLAIEKEAAKQNKKMPICLEWNVGEEESKTGASLQEVEEMLALIPDCPHVILKGLMCIPPFLEAEAVRPYFRQAKKLFEGMKELNFPNVQVEILSMGMSGDFPVAIEEGATQIRVGSGLFGKRNL